MSYWMTPDHPDWPVVECDPSEDRCRHEMAEETDIRHILARYGPLHAFPASQSFGAQDFDSDPTLEFQRIHAAREAYFASKGLSDLYPNWESAQSALAAGKLVYRDGELYVLESDVPSGASEAGTAQSGEAAAGEAVTDVTAK